MEQDTHAHGGSYGYTDCSNCSGRGYTYGEVCGEKCTYSSWTSDSGEILWDQVGSGSIKCYYSGCSVWMTIDTETVYKLEGTCSICGGTYTSSWTFCSSDHAKSYIGQEYYCRFADVYTCTVCNGSGTSYGKIACTHGLTYSHSYCTHDYTSQH